MSSSLIRRNILPIALETKAVSPVTAISGARQSGKTTLVHQLLKDSASRFVNLDDNSVRAAAQADPDGFADQYPEGTLAIDEIQRVPELLLSIKAALERNRKPGRFVITGSANLMQLPGNAESLAGRMQTINVNPLSQGEMLGVNEDFGRFAWQLSESGQLPADSHMKRSEYFELATATRFPEIVDWAPRQQRRWLQNYIDLVISKDVSETFRLQHPDRVEPLLQLFAAQPAGELVAANTARALNIPERSVPGYVSALKNVFLLRELPAWGNNITDRSIKKPKVSLVDPGIAAMLNGVSATGLELDISSALAGGTLEAFVVTELAKQQSWSEVDYQLRHWRDSRGNEVDVILQNPQREIVGLEVKATSSINNSHFKALTTLRDKAGSRFKNGIVLYTGTKALPFGERLWALPISTLWQQS